IHMDNIYQKSFYDLVGSVASVEGKLSKLMVSGDRGQHIRLLSDVSQQAEYAQTNLSQLPVSHIAIKKAQKYLNQLSDYTKFLNNKVSDGNTISDEELDNLRDLYQNASSLNTSLFELNGQVQRGSTGWGELASMGESSFYGETDDLVTRQFVDIENTGIDYPTLIYDGPFSETLNQKVDLDGPEITRQEAAGIATKFVGEKIVKRVDYTGEGDGQFATWTFNVETNNNPDQPIHMQISKKGGKVVNMIGQYEAGDEKFSIDEAKERAKRFLQEKGYPGMETTYQQQYDGVTIINFAYTKDGVIFYPDLIKVKISLRDGSILGFEARNYLLAHEDRDLKEVELTMEEARKLVNPNIELMSSKLAVIPTEGRKERLCYEFKGRYMGNTYIVYIDARTGQEADILQIIETENGSLAM
ncbi:MAG TPA: germination protein YpeB, partial [Bacillota bacterium]|nr:germination protein YpeB [Bacillota bacterium]